MFDRKLKVRVEGWRLKEPFRITGHVFESVDVLVVEIARDGQVGRGEASGVYYRADHPPAMVAEVEALRSAIESGIDRAALQGIMPAGGARNAVDCALWDLEAKLSGEPVWQLAGLDRPGPLLTTFTCSVATPESMAETARSFANARALKLKLNGDGDDAERVRAVRSARPDAWIGVDANQGFDRDGLDALLPKLIEADVRLIEQPFPIGRDAWLDDMRRPIPVAADESVQTSQDLEAMIGRYDVINIKLDKTGGLTEALAMAQKARKLGFDPMVGNMIGTSLSIAPAWLVGQVCSIADLDGPIFLAADRCERISYTDGAVTCPAELWGG